MTEHLREAPNSPVVQASTPIKAAADRAPLAERVIRALCVVGLVISTASMLELLAPLLIGDNPFKSYTRSAPTYRMVFMLLMVRFALGLTAGVVLFAGSIGELRGKNWGRVLLSLYVWLWVAGAAVTLAAVYTFQADHTASWGRGDRRKEILGTMVQHLGYAVSHSAYPLLLTVCLRWPESRRATSDSRGFRPVLPVAAE